MLILGTKVLGILGRRNAACLFFLRAAPAAHSFETRSPNGPGRYARNRQPLGSARGEIRGRVNFERRTSQPHCDGGV